MSDLQDRIKHLRKVLKQDMDHGFEKDKKLPMPSQDVSDISEICLNKKLLQNEESSTVNDSLTIKEYCSNCAGYNKKCPYYNPLKSE